MIGHGFPIAERQHFALQKPHAVHSDSRVFTLGPARLQTFDRSFSRHDVGGAQQGLDDRFQTIGFGASWCAVSVI